MTRQAHIQLGISPEFNRIEFYHVDCCKKQRWFKTNIAYLMQHWESMTDEELAEVFMCDVRRVVEKRNKLGLLRKRPVTTMEVEHVRVNYHLSKSPEIGSDIGRSGSSVRYIHSRYAAK